MCTPIIIQNTDFPENYQLLLDDYKKLVTEYNYLCSKLESLENLLEHYESRNKRTWLDYSSGRDFFP